MKGLTAVHRPDGITQLHLQGRFLHASVAVLDEHGKVRASCLDGPATASAADDVP
jgi:hypothetical protein